MLTTRSKGNRNTEFGEVAGSSAVKTLALDLYLMTVLNKALLQLCVETHMNIIVFHVTHIASRCV